MNQDQKELLKTIVQEHVDEVRSHITSDQDKLTNQAEQMDLAIKGAVKGLNEEEDVDLQKVSLVDSNVRLRELRLLFKSPYFAKLEINKDETVYIGKFQYFKDKVHSWTAPIARLRFEKPGLARYMSAHKKEIETSLRHKEQYMIIDGRVVFMAIESVEQPRTLIYQEHLQRKKTEFILPEIVEQMEKAQDDVIRADWKGSFLISGPAGSGKTTLALHRVAYLTQAPETEKNFPTRSMIVFVQDASTKAYFSALLPQLGIKRVTITTFEEWALSEFKLNQVKYVYRYGDNELEKDMYEFAKNQVLQSLEPIKVERDIFNLLRNIYNEKLPKEMSRLFERQVNDGLVDRFDLTLYIKNILLNNGKLEHDVVEYKLLKGMKAKKVIKREPFNYSLLVVDEAENYLKEQIEILKSCTSKRTEAILYVGDLAQQTKQYTINDWSLVGENFGENNKVVLQKVYRNTKEILEYIQSVGFTTTIPDGVRNGKEVKEFSCWSKHEELRQVIANLNNNSNGLVGVLGKTDEYLEEFKLKLDEYKNVRVMTIHEAQGVEFETVFLVGVNNSLFGGKSLKSAMRTERRKVDRDLLYVALTRAMNELYVLGAVQLKELVEELSN